MGSQNNTCPEEILEHNHQMLTLVHGGSAEKARASHVYSYKYGFRGFAAKLSEEQASKMATEMPGVVSVFPNIKRKLHTTHSWDFMGLMKDETMEISGLSTKNQENVIIGFLDTGIWPESPSFSDAHMPPVPSRWNGKCQTGEAFNSTSCNRKLIGARYYVSGYDVEEQSNEKEAKSNSDNVVKFRSSRDSSGHGSHTASTASGRYVDNMNFNGLAAGAARGGAPLSRIAVYKTCWDSGCYDADLLAAFDDAIKDGVDILSLSLGPAAPQGDYFNDAISVGSFHAASRGILVVSSVGNDGSAGSATNVAPWMLTVAATSTDRDFTSDILLGNKTKVTGESLSLFEMKTSARIIDASVAYGGYFTPFQSSYCLEGSLNRTKSRGKVLVCRHAESSSESKLAKSIVVKEAGGVGMVLIDEEDKDVAIPFVIPSAIVGKQTGDRILSFINQTRNSRSLILPAKTVLGSQPAPRIASFSSKGPNSLNSEILKPDIAAPGLNILASWSPALKKMNYNILSGTSMACPHVTGISALIKAVHPTWSPAAIKSAIMTSATNLDKNGDLITADPEGRDADPFDYGSGFMDPVAALDPGLIYDTGPEDYKNFLCSIGYDVASLRLLTGDNSICKKPYPSPLDLNYPSISVPDLRGSRSVTRTVTYVGKGRSIYRAVVTSPRGINVTVTPKLMFFTSYGQKSIYTVKFKVVRPSKGYVFGSLTWRKKHVKVTTPLVVRVAAAKSGVSR
ncbi:subtilisin-like serine-protease S [Aristolochia californica]|uniref:subtilisin-like serine-protease S n=1 Tax=Aristolochia californica TaxID=171875 RepID=UPI0035E332C7